MMIYYRVLMSFYVLMLTKFFVEGSFVLIWTTKGLFDNFQEHNGEIINLVKLRDYLKNFPL